jgi:starch phosphorylase
MFRPIVDDLLGSDQYLVLADFESYRLCQEQVSEAYQHPAHWTRMSILNTARSGNFHLIAPFANIVVTCGK